MTAKRSLVVSLGYVCMHTYTVRHRASSIDDSLLRPLQEMAKALNLICRVGAVQVQVDIGEANSLSESSAEFV